MKSILFVFACLLSAGIFGQGKPLVITTANTSTLIPEGITVSGGKIYVSSINEHKIIVMDEKGNQKDFITANQDNFKEGLGMKIDAKRKWLWALSNIKNGNQYTSQVHAFDLATGKQQQYYLITDTVPHLLNDLVIAKDGMIYITDTYYSAVYKLDPATRKLELFIKSKQLDYPNGLVFGKSDQLLYVATYVHGLSMLDLTTKQITPLGGYKDTAIAHALDGLVWWNNTIIGVYNYNPGGDRTSHAVIQYQLSQDGKAIAQERIIDRGNPLFFEPTTAALEGNKLYVIANSHLGFYNANKESIKGIESKLMPVVVIRYMLQ
ncbi:MAG TPA: SMP-30/gluconolactonase/LRE family protein [Chitinophagaceae bacterium]|nr:SMP-30/gluconolactonase/LRE family protein [Chitinophagaceae bacterium]